MSRRQSRVSTSIRGSHFWRIVAPMGRFVPKSARVADVCTRARNPRFYFVHAGTKPRFLTKNGHQNRGFRALVCTIAICHPPMQFRLILVLSPYSARWAKSCESLFPTFKARRLRDRKDCSCTSATGSKCEKKARLMFFGVTERIVKMNRIQSK